MRRLPAYVRNGRNRPLSQIVARSHHAGSGGDEVSEMKAADSTSSYLELLKVASPETIVVITALAVLALGLGTGRVKSTATVSTAKPAQSANETSTATAICSAVAALGLAIAIGAILMLPHRTTLFGGMLVITPLTCLFKIICIALAFFTILLTTSEKTLRHPGEYLALVLFATVGLMLLVGSEELLMIFIGLELLGLSLYVMTAFDKTDVRSAEAGLKYFLFGSTSSAFTLFGISLIYGMSGTTSLAAISEKLGTVSVQPLLADGIVMTLIGFGFNIGRQPRRACAIKRAQIARLLGSRACWIHTHWARCRRSRRIFRRIILRHHLCRYTRRCFRCSCSRSARNGWRRFLKLSRIGFPVATDRRMHVHLHVVTGRHTAARWIFWKVLSL